MQVSSLPDNTGSGGHYRPWPTGTLMSHGIIPAWHAVLMNVADLRLALEEHCTSRTAYDLDLGYSRCPMISTASTRRPTPLDYLLQRAWTALRRAGIDE